MDDDIDYQREYKREKLDLTRNLLKLEEKRIEAQKVSNGIETYCCRWQNLILVFIFISSHRAPPRAHAIQLVRKIETRYS